MSAPIERSYSLQFAETTLTDVLASLGYGHEFEMVGEEVVACRCILSDMRTGSPVASGNGKGELVTSRVGSLFEAAEHLLSNWSSLEPDNVVYLSSVDFCRGNKMCEALPLAILKDAQNANLPFLRYNAVNGSKDCFYPLALSCPSYIDSLEKQFGSAEGRSGYERLEHYSSNSGTAIGMNFEEAVIHGLLENIERTSLSFFLTNTFLLKKKNWLRVLDPSTLPDGLSDVVRRTELELDGKIMVFEMPNKFGIPAFCSWMEQGEFSVGFAGYGCSLSSEHAALRSVYELAQYFLLGKHIFGSDWLKELDEKTLSPLEGLSFHQECAKFDLGLKCSELGYEVVNFDDLDRIEVGESTQQYLSQLTDIIYANGEVPFASVLNVIGNGIHVTHAFITGEDRFFTVRLGKSSFPSTLDPFLEGDCP